MAESPKGISRIPDVARLEKLGREFAEARAQHGELTVRCVMLGDELWKKDYIQAGVALEHNDLTVRACEMLAWDAESAVTRERVNGDGRHWIKRLLKAGAGKKIISWQPEFEPRRAAGTAEGYKPEEAGPQFAAEACGAQKQHPSLRSLLQEPIFVMQAAQHGSLHHSVPDRQAVSVLVGRHALRDGLRQTRT
jgi:hypothetical protein